MKNFTRYMVLLLCGLSLQQAHAENKVIRLATTTTVTSSGLLDRLLPAFKISTGYDVEYFSVGTGKAIGLARDGGADLIWVHAPESEKKFITSGYGLMRYYVMHNDFIIVGPANDPAGIRGMNDAVAALKKISVSKSEFISRADDSGTHKREKKLWVQAGIEPIGSWYYEAGLGMGKVVQLAKSRSSYTIADRGSWLANQSDSSLIILTEDARQRNVYSLVAINPDKHPNVNIKGANILIKWLAEGKGKSIISNHNLNGEKFFHTTGVENYNHKQ